LRLATSKTTQGLLALADRSVAVGNAIPALKERATEVIGLNTQDSVALYLQADWRARCEPERRRR